MIDIFLGISPVIIILLSIFLFKKPLSIISPFVFLYTIIITLLFWRMEIEYLYLSLFKGFFISLDILIIIFGAIFFLKFLDTLGLIDFIKEKISFISKDARVQAILIVWFFGSFIEGIAGFGMPAVITAPLLVSLGFAPILAVSIALVGNSTAVIFGAVGTPIRIGFNFLPQAELAGIIFNAGLINLFAGSFVPIMIISLIVFSRRNYRIQEIREMIPFAFISGLSFTLPYFLLTFLSQEIPSILGPIIGLFIILFLIKKKVFIPKNEVLFIDIKGEKKEEKADYKRGVVSCLLFLLFLFITKISLPSFEIPLLRGVNHSFNLFNPGFSFLLAILFSLLIFKIPCKKIKNNFFYSLKKLIYPTISIFSIVGLVQVMIFSSNNLMGKEGMVESVLKIINPSIHLIISPIIGAFGSFISGSATVSNILFGNFQFLMAKESLFSVSLILALQLVGAGIGNIIALTNIISSEATVNLHGKEREIIKKSFIPFAVYLILVILIGLLINFFFYS